MKLEINTRVLTSLVPLIAGFLVIITTLSPSLFKLLLLIGLVAFMGYNYAHLKKEKPTDSMEMSEHVAKLKQARTSLLFVGVPTALLIFFHLAF